MEDSQLLRLQSQHRSSILSNNVLQCRHLHTRLPEAFMTEILQLTGFYRVTVTQSCKIDPTFITALVERWRPETHTFHFPSGESTITLQDVAIQLGLNVNGLAVTGPTYLDWPQLCEELLGKVPEPKDMKGCELKLRWLVDNFYDTPSTATDIERQQFCRAHILNMIGSVVMPDKSNNRVHLMYLPLLRDLTRVNRYSWGSACLAHLYKELCRATKPDAKSMGGCLVLLQSWAWYRLPFIAPICPPNNVFPLALRWAYYADVKHSGYPHGNLSAIRSRIDHMEMNELEWMPYTSFMNRLPRDIIHNAPLWRAYTPLICFSTVVWHQVDRVKLQFGFIQEIPQVPMNMDELHKIDKRGNQDVNWGHRHADWVSMWGNRHNSIMDGQIITGQPIHTEEYMKWFRTQSKIYLSSDQLLSDPRRRYMPNVIHPQSVFEGQSSHEMNTSPGMNEAVGMSSEYTPGPTLYSEFCTNLFGVDVDTPQSANTYIQHLTSYQQTHDAPGPSVVMHGQEPQQVEEEPQQTAEEQGRPDEIRRHPRRNRNRPPCGTGGCL